MKLTPTNYFTPDNSYLSNSKISKYLQSPSYFKALYIDKAMKQLETTALKKGKFVDVWITESKKAALEQFERKILKREDAELYELQKDKDYGKTLLNNTEWNQSISIINALKGHSMYNTLKSYTKQEILQYDKKLNEHFDGLAGIIDFYKIDDKKKTVDIVDLKTARAVTTPRAWFYKCKEYGYFNQFAMYETLIKKTYPRTEDYTFTHRHWVVKNTCPHTIRVYTINPITINKAKQRIKLAIERISAEKQYIDPEVYEEVQDYED